ncbi:MAG: PilZ domain-containing protein [Hyphomicrobiales bacterium]
MAATALSPSQAGADALPPLRQTLFGRFMLPDQSEHPCQVNEISLTGAVFITNQVPQRGQSIVAYLEEVGRIEVTSAEPVPNGFRVTISLTGARRDRLESRLRWLVQKQGSQGTAGDRRHARLETRETTSQITMPDGRVYDCEVLDVSLTGAAVKVDVMPSLGTYIMLGKMRGRVIRYLENGVAVEFTKPFERGAPAG